MSVIQANAHADLICARTQWPVCVEEGGGGETGEKEEVRGGRGVRKDVSVCPLYHGICHGRPLETVAPQ